MPSDLITGGIRFAVPAHSFQRGGRNEPRKDHVPTSFWGENLFTKIFY